MERVAFTMKLKPGFEAEYKRRHDDIWPELEAEIRTSGISDYSIFLDETTLTLFAVQKLAPDNTSDALSSKAIMQKWWKYMADIMDTNPDSSPVLHSLREVFHMD